MGNWSGVAQLWDVTTGFRLGPSLDGSGSQGAVAFSPDGRHVVAVARIWEVWPSASDDPQRLRLSVEVRAKGYIDEYGVVQTLTTAEWDERRRRLWELGGPCDIRTWAEVDRDTPTRKSRRPGH